ncbi:MAG TPA: hypothetical protein VGW38_13960, partial [Chloroflexota bacterium]|nr:hypothetical protein [Chloroflexota bacterium]
PAPDLKVWPHLLPAPPPEPPGLWEHLRSVAGEGGERGVVALHFLVGLSIARAIRQDQAPYTR